MEKTIKYLGKDVKIYQFYAESNNYLNARIDFLRKLEKNNINYKEAAKMTKTWQNIKFKNCKYKKKLYEKIKKYDKTI
jgi:hypothetical protein